MENPESIAGIVFSPDRTSVLLILRRDVPVWVLPGGGIEPNETPEQAVVREILEETGFEVKVDRLVGRYYPVNRLSKRTLLFECSVLGGSAQVSSETRGVKFISLDRLPPMPPPYLEWVTDAVIKKEPVSKHLHSVNYLKLAQHAITHPVLVLRFLLARMGLSINTNN